MPQLRLLQGSGDYRIEGIGTTEHRGDGRMSKLGLVFPGQGAQYAGMGKDLYDHFAEARECFTVAGDILKTDIAALCFNGPQSELDRTINTQTTVLTVGIAAFCVFQKATALIPAVMAGHSLGEFTALYAAGALDLPDVVSIVHQRAALQQNAVPDGAGCMAAIMGLERGDVEKLCRLHSTNGATVQAANYNGPAQLVISGDTAAVEKVIAAAKEKKARRVMKLPISIPCHCGLLDGAADRFGEVLARYSFHDCTVPVIPNYDPSRRHSREESSVLLARQFNSPVRWEETVHEMARMGVTTIIELGPKKTLSGLIKRIDDRFVLHHVEDATTLKKTVEALNRSQ